jgi:hypothetical protein
MRPLPRDQTASETPPGGASKSPSKPRDWVTPLLLYNENGWRYRIVHEPKMPLGFVSSEGTLSAGPELSLDIGLFREL